MEYADITDAASGFDGLWERMRIDEEAVYLNSYTLTGTHQFKDRAIPDTESVTMNEPAIFANAIVALFIASVQQLTVEGLSDKKNRRVEQFGEDLFYTIDMRLRKRQIAGLFPFAANHLAVRGPIGGRLTYDPDGRPNYLPIDMKYCVYDLDNEGNGWVAPLFHRSGKQIIGEYGKMPGVNLDGVDIKGKDYEVYDAWEDELNTIFIGGRKALERRHPYGRPPFVFEMPASGFMLQSQGHQARDAESIFMLDRGLYKPWNQLMSIQQSIALKSLMPGLVQPKKDLTGEVMEYADKPGTVTPVLEGEMPVPLKASELNKAFELARMDIQNALQRGGVNNIDLGNINQATAAIWISEQTQIRNRLLLPRLQSLGWYKSNVLNLALEEYQKLKTTPGLGKRGNQYPVSEMPAPEDITIEYRFMSRDTKQEIANLSMAAAAKGLYSLYDIHTNILKTDDPNGAIARLKAEQAEQTSQIIFFYRQSDYLLTLADQAKEIDDNDKEDDLRTEAKIMCDEMVEAIHQRKRQTQGVEQPAQSFGGRTQPKELPQGQGDALNALPSMFGRGNTVNSGVSSG